MPVVAQEYIEVDDRGVAKIIGTKSKVRMVVIDHNQGWPPEKIHEEYPHLSLSQIYAALAYYYDNKDAIDREIEEGDRFVEEMRAKNPNTLTREMLVERWKKLHPDRPVPGSD